MKRMKSTKSAHYLQFAFAFSGASSDGVIICNLSALRALGVSAAKQKLIRDPRMSRREIFFILFTIMCIDNSLVFNVWGGGYNI